MLESVRVLGNSFSKKSSLLDYLSVAKLKKTRTVLCVVVDKDSYLRISAVDRKDDDESTMKYLYAAGASNGPDRTPCSLITEPEKTLKKKLIPWFDRYSQGFSELENIGKLLKSGADKIAGDIKKEFDALPKENRQNTLLTIMVISKGNQKFIGELDDVRKILKDQFDDTCADISTASGTCYFCNEVSRSISEKLKLSDIFSFSTFDKKGFLYGFNFSASSNQMPICTNCYIDLKKGKEWLDKYAFFNFEGYKYYIIPEVWSWSDEKSANSLLEEFKEGAEHFARKDKDGKNLTYHNKNNLMQEEDYWLETLVSNDIYLRLNFLFVSLKGGGKYMDIEQSIQDVPTTWIKKVIDAFNNTLEDSYFKEETLRNILWKKWEGNLAEQKGVYLAGLVKSFFPTNSLDIKFLDVIYRILSGIRIERRDLFRSIMRVIRPHVHENWNDTRLSVVKSLALVLTMQKLMLITDLQRPNEKMAAPGDKDLLSILDEPSKKAVYLEGILVGKLLSIQYARRKATPFFDRLRGLNVSFQYAKSLFPETINKLREYQQAYSELEKDIAAQFMLAEQTRSTMSDDEVSYYFTLGLVLQSSHKQD